MKRNVYQEALDLTNKDGVVRLIMEDEDGELYYVKKSDLKWCSSKHKVLIVVERTNLSMN